MCTQAETQKRVRLSPGMVVPARVSRPRRRAVAAAAAALVVLCALAAAASAAAPPPSQRPNHVAIFVDDLRPRFGASYGHPEVLTPNLDKFAQRATTFQNAYVQIAVCGPSR